MAAARKGNKVELSMFLSWGKQDVFGYKTEELGGKTLVNFVWCKVCATRKEALLNASNVKDNIKKAIAAFADGTNVVTKYQVKIIS